MSCWWVNHKQTSKIELDEGYIWSPKQNNNGARNQFYLNLTRTKVGEIIFSYAYGKISAVGRIISDPVETQKPAQFESKGEHWSEIGWMVKVKWATLCLPLIPKSHLGRITPLLPSKYSPLTKDGNGAQCYLTEISEKLASELLHLTSDIDDNIRWDLDYFADEIESNLEESKIAASGLPITVREQLTLARVGQGVFRSRLERIESNCRVTGLSNKRLLIASHIKPWKNSNNDERLDGNNGFLMSPHIDKLFDQGWISFSKMGKILVRNEKIKSALSQWSVDPDVDLGRFTNYQLKYLEYHRDVIFK